VAFSFAFHVFAVNMLVAAFTSMVRYLFLPLFRNSSFSARILQLLAGNTWRSAGSCHSLGSAAKAASAVSKNLPLP